MRRFWILGLSFLVFEKQPKLQIAVKVAVRVVASGAALCGARMGCLVLMLGLAVSLKSLRI